MLGRQLATYTNEATHTNNHLCFTSFFITLYWCSSTELLLILLSHPREGMQGLWRVQYASMPLWLLWELLHVGNYSWQPHLKGSGIVNFCDSVGRSHTPPCALQHHSCGERKPLPPLISACSPLWKNNMLLAFCLHGTWLLLVLISGLEHGHSTDAQIRKNTTAVASGHGFVYRLLFFFFFPLIGKCVSH